MKSNLKWPGPGEWLAWLCFLAGAASTWEMPRDLDRVREYYESELWPRKPENIETFRAIEHARWGNPFGHGPLVMVLSLLAAGIMRTQRHCALALLQALEAQPAATAEAIRASARAAKQPPANPSPGP